MEQVDVDQVQTSVRQTEAKYGDIWQVDIRNRKQSDNKCIRCVCMCVCLHLHVFMSALMSTLLTHVNTEFTNKHICLLVPSFRSFFFGHHCKAINVHPTSELSWLTVCCCGTQIVGSFCYNPKVTTQQSKQ